MKTERLLKKRIKELESENTALRQRLRSLKPLASVPAEAFIAELVGGKLTSGLADHDIICTHGKKFEVKFSRLNIPAKSSTCRRWSWGHPLGVGGAKLFHRLILVGEADPRFKDSYRDPKSPYVIFDIPFRNVEIIMRKDPIIQITTNPSRAHGDTAKLMFKRFHVSSKELRDKHRKV